MTDTLGPLADRVPEALRGSSAYHVPQPPEIRAKLDANELPFAWPAELRAELGAALAEVALERYPDPRREGAARVIAGQYAVRGDQLVFGNGSDELIAMLCAAFAGPILYPVPTFVYYKLARRRARHPRDRSAAGAASSSLTRRRSSARSRSTARASCSSRCRTIRPARCGGSISRAELAARHRDTVIVSDEAYVAYSGVTNLRRSPRTRTWS